MKTNTLYFGDNLRILRDEIQDSSVDLIYIDPPFSSARNYFVIFKDRTGKASEAQNEAFSDTWDWGEAAAVTCHELVTPKGSRYNHELATAIAALKEILRESPMMAYLVAMSIRLVELHRVLKPTGSFYLHCDPTASHYLKIVCDAIWGPENFKNEIIWKRTSAHANATAKYGAIHDSILYYTKSERHTWNVIYSPYSSEYVDTFFDQTDSDGRRYARRDLTASMQRASKGQIYSWKGVILPESRCWAMTIDKMDELDAKGKIHWPSKKGGIPRLKYYADEAPGTPVQDIWDDVRTMHNLSTERLGYPTQKPLALLRRIVEASSNPEDVVLDAFCGCGTAVHAAHELGRHWIGIDVASVAVGVIKSRMEQSFPDLVGKIPVEGFPTDLEGARTLFETDPHQFQEWACIEIGAVPLTKRGADKGIDGWLPFADIDEAHHRGVVQVKGGKVSVSQVRDFCHVISREKATLGFFVCMGQITKPMEQEAIGLGIWHSANGNTYPRCQLLSIEDVLARRAGPRLPMQEKRSILGYKATKATRAKDKNLQLEL